MKRLISILVIATMLFASVMAMIPASAEKVSDAATYTYNVDWAGLKDAGKMQTNGTGNDVKSNAAEFLTQYTVNADATSLVVGLNTAHSGNYEQRFYISTEMFEITDSTYYEYVFSGKNNRATGYGGFVFAYDANNYPYMIMGSTDNKSDDGDMSEIRVLKGDKNTLTDGNTYYGERDFIVLDTDDNGFGTMKVVYDGYNVSFYGLTDAENGTYAAVAEDLSFELPEGAKIAVGVFSRDSGSSSEPKARTVSIKNAVLTAHNTETATIIAGSASEEKLALAKAIDKAELIVVTTDVAIDYTETTAAAFNDALAAAKEALEGEELGYAAATTALVDAIDALEANEVDFSVLRALHLNAIYDDEFIAEFNQNRLSQWIAEAEAALVDADVLQSQVNAIVEAIYYALPEYITTAEEFAAMEPDGAYALMANITIEESYGEFRGELEGNGFTVTLNGAEGVFETLNGANIYNLSIAGSIEASATVGALATDAKGDIYLYNVVNNASVTVNSSGKNVAGFIAQAKGANITFYNCVNNADIVGGRTAGFLANANSGNNNLYFNYCVNNGDISCGPNVATNPAAGFVARSTEAVANITFEYCANFGDIDSKYSAGSFFGCGMGDVDMYGCVALGVTVTAADSASHIRPIGGIIGGGSSADGEKNITINACYFDVDVVADSNKTGNPVALVVGGVNAGTIEISNTVVVGTVTNVDNEAYKLSSDTVIEDNVFIDVVLQKNTFENDNWEELDLPKYYTDVNPEAAGANVPNTVVDPDAALAFGDYGYKFLLAAVYGDEADKREATKVYENSLAGFDADMADVVLAMIEEKAFEDAAALEFSNALIAAYNKLGELVSYEDYTADSWLEYVIAYEAIAMQINMAENIEALEAIDVEALAAAANAKLVTLEAKAAADAAAEAAAKAEAEAAAKAAAAEKFAYEKEVATKILGAKRENTDKLFTADSYTAYAAAFDAILAKINAATDLTALSAINVSALKVEAENKLEVAVPEAADDGGDAVEGEGETAEVKDEVNDAQDGNADDAADAKEDKGCSASVAISAIAIVGVIGTAVALKKKED